MSRWAGSTLLIAVVGGLYQWRGPGRVHGAIWYLRRAPLRPAFVRTSSHPQVRGDHRDRAPAAMGFGLPARRRTLVSLGEQEEVLRLAVGAKPVLVGPVPEVEPGGEGGLLGIAVSPTFGTDQMVLVYLSARDDNPVMAMTFDGTKLAPGRSSLKASPKAANHDGGRLAFGPDGYLYIATGDAGLRAPAQDNASPNGKTLRVTAEGTPAPAIPSPAPASGPWAIATSRGWPGAGPEPCMRASSARTSGTS